MHEKLLLQLMSNCFAIHEAGNGLSLGLGLFPIGSVLNHSSRCAPPPLWSCFYQRPGSRTVSV